MQTKPPASAKATFDPKDVLMAHPLEPDDFDFPDQQFSEGELSDEQYDSDEGDGSSDTTDKPEQTEDMNDRETVQSIWSFMGWNHIPTFQNDLSEPDKSNNPKNTKRPARISVAR